MKFRFIRDFAGRMSRVRLCQAFGVSRSGLYASMGRPESQRGRENRILAARLQIIHAESHETYGLPRVMAELSDLGVHVNHKRVERLRRQNGLKARVRKRFKPTTNSKHDFPIAENVLDRNFEVAEANKVWAGDITYIPTREGWLYLAVVLDLFSRKVVGWAMSRRIDAELALDALRMAFKLRKPKPGLLFHSDRGSVYACYDYKDLLAEYLARPSMSRKGNCWDNAVSESFFSTLKGDWLDRFAFETRSDAEQQAFYFIEAFYNRRRRHSALGYLSPVAFEAANKATMQAVH
jgi:putative transposase